MQRSTKAAVLAISSTLFAAGAYYAFARSAGKPPGSPDNAPGRTAKRWFGDHAVVGRTVTINRPREDLYAFWRNFENLPKFMENIEAVHEDGPGTWTWTIAAPAGSSVDVTTNIVEERENALIAWRSTEDSAIEASGRITFRDAPNGRGTEVEAIVAYVPPAGEIGRLIAKLFQREPNIQGRRELKRFKMLMETGEVATALNHRPAA